MANFTDLFNDTAGVLLTAHTADSGGSWAVPPAGTAWTIGPSGEAFAAPSFTTRCSPTVAPASADYTVRAKFKRVTDVAGINAGIYARGDISSSTQHGYFFRYVRSTNLWRVDLINAGATSTLGSGAATVVDGVTYQMELSAIGSTITAKIDGATVWTGTSTAITTAGTSGVAGGGAASSATTGVHLLDFEQVDVASSSAGADQVDVEPYATVTLTGTGTAATWSQTAGTPTVTLGGSGAVCTFEAPATLDGTTLTFAYGGDSMTVTVLPHNTWQRSGGGRVPVRIVSRT